MRTAAATSRGLVLDVVRQRRAVSRVELAEITGLTQATISTVVRGLLDDDLLVESGEREFTGGKPRVKLVLNPRARCAVGVQLGADWIILAVVDAAGAIVARTRVRGARDEAPEAVVPSIARDVEHLLAVAGLPQEVVVGLGLALPGVVDLERGSIVSSRSLSRWEGFGVRDALADAAALDVVVETNSAAAAIGEFWASGDGDSKAHATLYMGAGLGAGIVLAGSLYRGASGNAGAMGPVDGGPGRSGQIGLEDLAGPAAVAAHARAALARGRTSSIVLPEPADPFTDFAAVATAAVLGDPLATSLVEDSAEHVADAALTLANVLDLDSIVLAGPSFAVAGSIYLAAVRHRVATSFHARGRHGVDVRLSAQISDAAAVGSAALVLQQELAPRHLGVVSELA